MFKRRSIAAVAVVLVAVGCAPPAAADPAEDLAVKYGAAVCKSLDETPTIDGVLTTGMRLVKTTGVTPYVAGEVLAYSVVGQCPQHIDLLKRFIAKYKGERSV
ncbi:hypothetical protein AOT93_26540 [Mycobacteroides sp. H110]|nr:hypothetical protein AOT87_04055 [Mycobacteroides sp. H003]KRQ33157.1 hypothetical protein AOT92_28135 [Mycobacteroides sp. H101]KRQ33412.1 hypothetical protein AOT91_09910 [Mycobacteroides sp. H092]KRQ51261.1 hypothetical protein AOT88_07950 [Mycobacteroides sp. H063]KRQ56745.1 hypothetical protein AOT94_17930 [Mycobacteroides sp. HXVII]KRQ69110.1 hypothetical protein AOT90_00455 [Mycobacteroides sp. H079]KRQ74016.1 hypothetical protein AOT93_26540 [Mycobacteroides sp. H110]KRQ79953.1 hy